MKITILFDNLLNNSNIYNCLEPLWGFSALIEFQKYKILFDTGSNGRILLQNANCLNIDLKNIDLLFISHSHWDHIGGWDTIAEINKNTTIAIPDSLSKHLIADLKNFFRQMIIVGDENTEILPNIYSTGVLYNNEQNIGEQSLIIKEDYGATLFVGCSHYGITNIINHSEKIIQSQLYYVIGGFHLLHKTEQEIKELLPHIRTKYITPTHCTGEIATNIIAKKYNKTFIYGGIGAQIQLPF